MRTSLLFVFVGLAACAAGEGDGAGGSGGEAAFDGPVTSSTGQGATTSTSSTASGASECVLETPCASDLQCTTLAGTACNAELTPPRCQHLACEGKVPCDGRDAFCSVDRNCRIADHAAGFACLPRAETAQDCMTSCNTAPRDPESCDGAQGPVSPGSLCAQLCASDICLSYEGIKYIEAVSACSFSGAEFEIRCVGDAFLRRWLYPE